MTFGDAIEGVNGESRLVGSGFLPVTRSNGKVDASNLSTFVLKLKLKMLDPNGNIHLATWLQDAGIQKINIFCPVLTVLI